jgi:glycerol-3-phosphate dehydrogenase (NAD(P)+)
MKKIAILGAGAFGFALAKIIGDKHVDTETDIYIFDIQKEYIDHIKETKTHPLFKEDGELADFIKATHSLKDAVDNSDLIILAVPSLYMRDVLKDVKPFLQKKTILLNIAKGLEQGTNMIMSNVIDDALGEVKDEHDICSLSGGMIAKEVILKNPLCAEIACVDIEVANRVSNMVENERFRIETTTDIIGIDLAGAFKNVVAVGSGIFDGLGYSESSKSAFVSYAAKQISELAFAMGAKKETFDVGSQAWFGDLMTSCFGKARNREFGEMIGKLGSVKKALEKLEKEKKTVEGYRTTKVVYDLMQKHKVKAPLIVMIYKVLYEGMSPEKFVESFINDW